LIHDFHGDDKAAAKTRLSSKGMKRWNEPGFASKALMPIIGLDDC
jgi:hypothetical protein